MTVSTGDSGFGIACPANQNTVVAVGGTTLNLNGSGGYVSESAWSGGGSGCSTVINAQSWQTTATNWAAIGCGTKRGMADVSADADPNTGAAVYDSYGCGGWLPGRRDEPLVAADRGRVRPGQQRRQLELPGAERLRLPGQPARRHHGQQRIVRTCTAHPLQCHAGAGYDLPTGIGTPNGLGGF